MAPSLSNATVRTPDAPGDEADPARIEAFVDEAVDAWGRAWRATPATLPADLPRFSRRHQRRAARRARALVDELGDEIEAWPREPAARRAWRDRVEGRLRRFGEEWLGWPDGYSRLLAGDGFARATAGFVRSARRFDPGMPRDELFQALRNVWIGNSVQILLDLPVEHGPALFAYSMLYPLTDNLLDDPAVSAARKTALGQRLGRRLRGESLPPADGREAATFRMVEKIEAAWPRRRWPAVWGSLLAIHRAQGESLRQQRRAAGDDEERLLAVSCEKGGTSVLADGYLVAGRLAPADADFLFGYGVWLQLLDDLQDARDDRERGHMTLFSRLAGRTPLDELTARLLAFGDRVLGSSPRLWRRDAAGASRLTDLGDLIRRNCRLLATFAVEDQPELFGRRFRRRIETASPLSFRAWRRLRRRAERRWDQARARLAEGGRAPSLAETLATPG